MTVSVLRSESLAPLDRIDCISSSCGVEYFRAGASFRREACKQFVWGGSHGWARGGQLWRINKTHFLRYQNRSLPRQPRSLNYATHRL